jgi:hypothetical protein
MTINRIFKESGPQIVALIDPSFYQTEVLWFYRTSVESLIVSGSIKASIVA